MIEILRAALQLICNEEKNYDYCVRLYSKIGGHASLAEDDIVREKLVR